MSPVRASDASAAVRLFAIAVELVVSGVVAHGVIEGDLLADFDIAHGDETGWSAQAGVGIATVIETVRGVADERVVEKEFLFNLQNSFGKIGDIGIELVYGNNLSAPKGEHFVLGNWLSGKDAATAFKVKWSRFELGIEVGKELVVHSLVPFGGWK